MKSNFSRLALSAVAASLIALPVFAQSTEWRADSNHSSARIAVKAQNPGETSISLGSASAAGILRVDNRNPEDSTFQFDLYPAGAASAAASDDPSGSTHITFRSEKASLTSDGKLKFTGTLTVSSVVRDVQLEGNEAYSGPVETGRVVYQASREESLILAIPASSHGRAFTDVSTSLKINAEDFPELVDELLAINWPSKAQSVSCEPSTSFGEDYSGTLCTGASVESRSVTRVATSISEDYSGGEPISAQPTNVVTFALHLRLAQQREQVSAKTGQ